MKVRDTSGREVHQEEINMGSHKIINVTDCSADQEVATKKYVDDNAGGAPGGANWDVQFNNNGAFGGDNTFIYRTVQGRLHVETITLGVAGVSTYNTPLADGTANQIIETDGSGTLSWVTPHAVYGRLTTRTFIWNPATGNFSTTSSAYINDGDGVNSTSEYASANGINEYAEVILLCPLQIRQFRQFGAVINNGDGRWKIQYQNLAYDWVDWVTGIPARDTADWSTWDSSGAEVVAVAIKLICTTVDTGAGDTVIYELQVKY